MHTLPHTHLRARMDLGPWYLHDQKHNPAPPCPRTTSGGGRDLAGVWGAGGGTEGERLAGSLAQSRQPLPPPAPPPGLAPPSPSDSFRTDSVPNTSQGTPALPRPPTPPPSRLRSFTKVITHCYTDSLYRGQKGRRSRGEKKAEGREGGRTEGGRERD